MEVKFKDKFLQVEYVLNSKREELLYLNYNSLTNEKIWEYCVEKRWRKRDIASIPMHEMVSDIFKIHASDMISYIQIAQHRELQNGLSPINLEELEMLLGPTSLKKENEMTGKNDNDI